MPIMVLLPSAVQADHLVPSTKLCPCYLHATRAIVGLHLVGFGGTCCPLASALAASPAGTPRAPRRSDSSAPELVMSDNTKLVAVCGATGKQGGGMVAALLRRGGFRVRALTRNPDSPSSANLAAQEGVKVRGAACGTHVSCCADGDWQVACTGDRSLC